MEVDHFRAMGSDASLLVIGGPRDLTTLARERIGDLEARWSRFIPTSEVSRLNHLAGEEPMVVSPETLAFTTL